MAYSAEFLAKIAEKPDWLTPSEKARTFATLRGWEYRPAQFTGERYANHKTELLVAIPGLSKILDLDTAGVAQLAKFIINKTDIGFTRRSRRRYSLNVGFQEAIYLGVGVDINFRLHTNFTTALAKDGSPLQDTGSNAVTGIPYLDLNVANPASATELLRVGSLTFDIPTFSADPGELKVTITDFKVESASVKDNDIWPGSNIFADADSTRNMDNGQAMGGDFANYEVEIVAPDDPETPR
jgi:hypothetical protein